MWLKKPWVRKLRNRLIVLAVIALALLWMYRHEAPAVTSISNYSGADAAAFMSKLSMSGDAPTTEQMSYGGATWYKMSEQRAGSLWLDPAAGQIAVKTAVGEMWLSNPSKEDQEQDPTKGQWKKNAASPILVNYYNLDTKAEETANTIDSEAVITWKPIENGVGVRYEMKQLGISVYLEYVMAQDGFVVHLPQEGVTEGAQFQVVSLSVLPFFGAALDDGQGYLFVPDGPGGLITFGKKRAALTLPYDYPVYGRDWSIPAVDNSYFRESINYPVFGMKRGDQGFISVIEQGEATANIVAMPSQLKTSFNNVYAKFKYRNHYFLQKGLDPNNVNSVYEKALNVSSFTMRYLFLEKDASDYVGMAKRYRTYLADTRKLTAGNAAGAPPLTLDFIMAASEQPTPLGASVVVVSTFDEVKKIVDDLYAEGIHSMRVNLRGWQKGGFAGSIPDRFPIDGKLGGRSGFLALQKHLKEKGIPLVLNDDLKIGIDSFGSGFSPKKDGVRQITGKVVKFYQNGDFYNQALYYYTINPWKVFEDYLPGMIKDWQGLSVGGVALMDEYGDGLFSDYMPGRTSNRSETAALTNQTLDLLRSKLGWAGTSNPFAFSIGHADMFYNLPLDYNYDLAIDERVPFYPMALHGLVAYTSGSGTLRTDPGTEFLRELEYGALPYYVVTAGDIRDLSRTTYSGYVSGQYQLVKSQMVSEYKAFAATGGDVWNSYMDGHRKLADGVYETSYENGTRIIVNYNEQAYASVDGVKVKANNYAVIRGEVGK
ncbi:DUF5696 domain-containing protein [Paenibacillus lignilyticus]|uniref:Uncharacterized protein n=1 Tax=Paenibacillus lignilyticus TaxID=1172615 RepID=A0ABS5C852_9BACL|nr:hypothetical protein [Paenibacillus lignilyticus]